MPTTRVERLMQVDVYECDAPTCREVCTSYDGFACGWLWIFDPTEPRNLGDPCFGCWQYRARRFLCSWSCLADWARAMGQAVPLVTQDPRALPHELPT